jgi:hypothetical protein
MGRSSQISVLLLVVLLLLSSAQCMMGCVVAPCHAASQSSLPPCHRHHAPANQVPPGCSHPLTMEDTGRSSAADLVIADFTAAPLFPPIAFLSASQVIDQGVTPGTASPPGITALSTVILRI